MAEISKTAKASMIQAPKQAKAEESVEEAIRQIRIDREAGLFVVRMDRVDKLLAAYDRERLAVTELAPACAGLLKRAETAEASLRSANEELQAYLRLGKMAETIFGQPIDDRVVPIEPSVVMAEIPAHGEDEHYLVDFGHHTVHPHHEGA